MMLLFLANADVSAFGERCSLSCEGKGIFAGNYTLTKFSNATDFAPEEWSHDGKFIMGYNNNGIFILDLESGTRNELLSALNTYQLEGSDQTVRFDAFILPRLSFSDDKLLVYANVHIDGIESQEGFKYDIKNGILTKLTNNAPVIYDAYPNYVMPATWFPDGNILLIDSITENDDPSTSRYVVWLADQNGQKQKQLFTVKDLELWPEVSTDGKKIVFFRTEPTDSDYYHTHFLMVYDVDNGKLAQVPNFSSYYARSQARLSPNSELVLFYTYFIRSPYNDIQVASLDGQLHESIFQSAIGEASVPIFSPDGQRLFFNLNSPYNQTESGLYFVEFAHSMPEFGLMTMPLLSIVIIILVGMVLYPKFFHH